MLTKQTVKDVFTFQLTKKTVTIFFFILIAALPLANKFSKFAAILFLIVFFKSIYIHRDFVISKAQQLFLGGLFVLIMVSNLLAGLMTYNFKKDFYLLTFILLYYATLYFLEKKMLTFKVLRYAVIIPMSFYMLDGFFQYYVGYDILFHNPITSGGINAVSKNRNLFALAAFFYFVVLLFLSIERKEKIWWWVYPLLFLSILTIFLTLCRQMWIATFVVFFIVALYKYRSLSLKHVGLIVLALFVAMAIFANVPSLFERLHDLEQMNSSGRFEFWKLLLEHIGDAPWLGHSLQSPIIVAGSQTAFKYAHNLTLGVLYAWGVVGIVFYLLFLGYFANMLYRCKFCPVKPYLVATFVALIFVQQQLGGSMLIHKFIGPSIMIFLALVTHHCSLETFIRIKER